MERGRQCVGSRGGEGIDSERSVVVASSHFLSVLSHRAFSVSLLLRLSRLFFNGLDSTSRRLGDFDSKVRAMLLFALGELEVLRFSLLPSPFSLLLLSLLFLSLPFSSLFYSLLLRASLDNNSSTSSFVTSAWSPKLRISSPPFFLARLLAGEPSVLILSLSTLTNR